MVALKLVWNVLRLTAAVGNDPQNRPCLVQHGTPVLIDALVHSHRSDTSRLPRLGFTALIGAQPSLVLPNMVSQLELERPPSLCFVALGAKFHCSPAAVYDSELNHLGLAFSYCCGQTP